MGLGMRSLKRRLKVRWNAFGFMVTSFGTFRCHVRAVVDGAVSPPCLLTFKLQRFGVQMLLL